MPLSCALAPSSALSSETVVPSSSLPLFNALPESAVAARLEAPVKTADPNVSHSHDERFCKSASSNLAKRFLSDMTELSSSPFPTPLFVADAPLRKFEADDVAPVLLLPFWLADAELPSPASFPLPVPTTDPRMFSRPPASPRLEFMTELPSSPLPTPLSLADAPLRKFPALALAP